MKITGISLSVVALTSLMIVNTGCANDLLKQTRKDIWTGVKIGGSSALLVSGGTLVAKNVTKKMDPTCPLVAVIQNAPVPLATLLVVKNVDKIVNPEENKKTNLQSQAIQTVATLATYVISVKGIEFLLSMLPQGSKTP